MSRFLLLVISLCLYGLITPATQAESRFFPPGVWGAVPSGVAESQQEYESDQGRWFEEKLQGEGEKPLWVHRAKSKATLSIRVSDLASMTIPDFSFRRFDIMPDGTISFFFRYYSLCRVGQKSDVPGPHCLKRLQGKGTVDPDRTAKIVELLDRIAPLTAKTPSMPAPGERGFDGTTTLFEFSGDNKYNLMVRWELDEKRGGDLGRLKAVLVAIVRDAIVDS